MMEHEHVPLTCSGVNADGTHLPSASSDGSNVVDGRILCCECGVSIAPNPTGTCAACLGTRVDIGVGVAKQAVLYFCGGCERYLQPPATWLRCQLESRQLLALCLQRLRGLTAVRLTDAAFVWTEPHSRRIKVRVTIQKEVQPGAVLQQNFIVEYVVHGQMCSDCHRREAKDFWRAQVQVRTRARNKQTLFYVEQLVLRQRQHETTTDIKQTHDGLDFLFATEAAARKFVGFVESVIACRVQHSKKLISHDAHSNIYNYKMTFAVEIAAVNRHALVCLPRRLAHQLGGIGQLCVVTKVTNMITLVDPSTAQIAELHASQYWRYPFTTLCDSRQLIEYTVMDVERATSSSSSSSSLCSQQRRHGQCTDVWLVRSAQLGCDGVAPVHARTHLPGVKVGDTLLCVDLASSNVNDDNLDSMSVDRLPDIVPVRRKMGDSAARRRRRRWKLRRLRASESRDTATDTSEQHQYAEFLDDLEEDPAMRQHVNIYRDPQRFEAASEEDGPRDHPEVGLEEMMEDLNIDDYVVPECD